MINAERRDLRDDIRSEIEDLDADMIGPAARRSSPSAIRSSCRWRMGRAAW
jgi:hypothetical protein